MCVVIMANIKQDLSINTIVMMIFNGLVVAIIVSFMIGYKMGRTHESIVNLNEITYGGIDNGKATQRA